VVCAEILKNFNAAKLREVPSEPRPIHPPSFHLPADDSKRFSARPGRRRGAGGDNNNHLLFFNPMNTKIEIRDPQDLRLHKLQKKYIPEPDKEGAEWPSFVDALSAAGPEGIPPIVITPAGDIMEGGRRWRGAKQLGWREIQVTVRPDEDAAAMIVESLLGQRNLLRGAKVYIALSLLPEFVKSAEDRRLLHLRNGVKTLEKPLSTQLSKPESLRGMAEKLGVSHELVSQAIWLLDVFAKRPDLRDEFEPKILDSTKPMGIGSVVAGVGFLLKQKDDHRGSKNIDAERQMQLFNGILESTVSRWGYWQDFDASMKSDHFDSVRKIAAGLKPEQLEPMADYFSKLASELRKAAKA